MKIAMVITVKNEERILRDNLLYHKALGCEKIYVYFDNTSDNSKESIKDLNFVEINNSVAKDKYEQLDFLFKFTSQMELHHTARQCINTYDATCKCKNEKIDWLISLDADELIAPNISNVETFQSFFKKIPLSIDVVNFQVCEVLQRKETYANVFAEEVYFKTTYKFKSRFERVLKNIYNPFLNKKVPFTYWYGQHLGKAAIRVNNNIIPHNVHRYKKIDGTPIALLNAGYLLHYHAYDIEDFIKKFKNFKDHPTTFLSGNKVDNLKLLLRDVVNDTSATKTSLSNYFIDNLLFSEKEVARLLKNKKFYLFPKTQPAVLEIQTVSEVFKKMKLNNYKTIKGRA